ncbi:hypothetical protein FN846DRAFT_905086 [Sphaerosporella brunnea]|uniref:Uncharacterized protein n=1 Tax=Sphaerosporella brunnea TaxID=1250544 RepID=A0A5J5F264_9PEZI|nr:hypothetical protein FN846DRAFT_905086 [Sphaerosporella brunnea]
MIRNDTHHPNCSDPPPVPPVQSSSDQGKDSVHVLEADNFPGFSVVEPKHSRFLGVLEAQRRGIGSGTSAAAAATEADDLPVFPIVERKKSRFLGILEASRRGIGLDTSVPAAAAADKQKDQA